MSIFLNGLAPSSKDAEPDSLKKINAILAGEGDSIPVTATFSGTVTATPPKSATANTPSIGTSAGTALSANSARNSWAIQNLGTNVLYVRMGASASTSEFHFALAPGSSNDDGRGASVSDDTFTGIVSVAGTSPRFTASEL
jgi:hypothetical protein